MIPILPNQGAVILLGLLFGAAVGVNFIGAESYLLSVAQPVFAVYSTALAGAGYWFFLSYLNIRKLKFAGFSLLAGGLYVIALLALTSQLVQPVPRGLAWFFLAVFGHRFFRWIVAQLILKHLDPARAQAHLSYLVATYEAGMLGALLALKVGGASLTPNQAIYVTSILSAAGLYLVAQQFMPARNLEIHFSRRAVSPLRVDSAAFRPLLSTFAWLAFCFGAFKISEEHLIRTVLKADLGSYEAIRDVVTNYRIVGNFAIIAIGLVLARLIRRKHLSPIAVLQGKLALVGVAMAACLALRSLPGFAVLEVARWVGENCLWFLSSQMIVSSLVDDYRSRMAWRQNFFFFIIAALPLLPLLAATQSLSPASLRVFLIALIALTIVVAMLLLARFRKQFSAALYAFVSSGHKAAGVLATNMISFVRPKNYETEMTRILALSPKKLLRKNIILSLGYSSELRSLDTVIREFETDQEEIQIAVLEALRISQRYKAVQFLVKVTRADVRPRTIRVRINATRALAAMYGKHSIPFLLHGLDDPDQRIVANTLETLSEFRDPDLIPYFELYLESPVARVRTNALMGLARFRKTRGVYRTRIAQILDGSDPTLLASTLYVLGAIRDRHFTPRLHQILESPMSRNESVRRCLAWALIQMDDPRGPRLFSGLFERQDDSFMHFFSQLPVTKRMDLVTHVVRTHAGEEDLLRHFEQALHSGTFDFHEELDYFYLLRGRVETGETPTATPGYPDPAPHRRQTRT